MLFCCVWPGTGAVHWLHSEEEREEPEATAERSSQATKTAETKNLRYVCTVRTAPLTVLGSVYSGKDNVCKIGRKCEIIFSFKMCLFDFTNIRSPI